MQRMVEDMQCKHIEDDTRIPGMWREVAANPRSDVNNGPDMVWLDGKEKQKTDDDSNDYDDGGSSMIMMFLSPATQ
jgi:hypothetical protein